MKALTVGVIILVSLFFETRATFAQAQVWLCNQDFMLTDACVDGNPLPDGTAVRIYWDANNNGPDPSDVMPPVGDCPACLVINSFPLNGETELGIPGTFCGETGFGIGANFPQPWRFFLRVLVCDNDIMWTTPSFTLVDGYQEVDLSVWNCEPCAPPQPQGVFTLFNETTVLTQFCFGGPPISDGTEVSIYWDANGNGPDSLDTLAVFGECPTCVPFSSFLMNGEVMLGQAGTFYLEQSIVVNSSDPLPWIFYLRVPLCDHDVIWTSDTFQVFEGNQEISVENWECDPCPILDDVPGAVTPVANTIALHANYPNPFNPSTEIRFDLPHEMSASLKVYDVLGREVAELVNGTMNAGTHTVTYDASALSSGVYFYRLEAGSFIETHKMILMK